MGSTTLAITVAGPWDHGNSVPEENFLRNWIQSTLDSITMEVRSFEG